MKYLLFISLFIIFSPVNAQEDKTVIQLHSISYHTNRAVSYNENNYGLGFRRYINKKYVTYYNAGFYKNSEYRQSKYIGVGWEKKEGDFTFGITAGILTGYDVAEVVPYVLPVIRYGAFSLIFAPYPEAVTHLTIDVAKF